MIVAFFPRDTGQIQACGVYMNSEPITEKETGSYVESGADIQSTSVTWNHGLAVIISSLLRSGLKLDQFKEFNYSPYHCFRNTVKIGKDQYQIKGLENKIPKVYGLKLTKTI